MFPLFTETPPSQNSKGRMSAVNCTEYKIALHAEPLSQTEDKQMDGVSREHRMRYSMAQMELNCGDLPLDTHQ